MQSKPDKLSSITGAHIRKPNAGAWICNPVTPTSGWKVEAGELPRSCLISYMKYVRITGETLLVKVFLWPPHTARAWVSGTRSETTLASESYSHLCLPPECCKQRWVPPRLNKSVFLKKLHGCILYLYDSPVLHSPSNFKLLKNCSYYSCNDLQSLFYLLLEIL